MRFLRQPARPLAGARVRPEASLAYELMFDSHNTFKARIAGGVDLLIDVATLGEFGLEEVDAPVSQIRRDRHADRSHTSAVHPLPRTRRETRTGKARTRRQSARELGRFFDPKPAGATVTELAPIRKAKAIAAQEASDEAAPRATDETATYRPCTAAARRLAGRGASDPAKREAPSADRSGNTRPHLELVA